MDGILILNFLLFYWYTYWINNKIYFNVRAAACVIKVHLDIWIQLENTLAFLARRVFHRGVARAWAKAHDTPPLADSRNKIVTAHINNLQTEWRETTWYVFLRILELPNIPCAVCTCCFDIFWGNPLNSSFCKCNSPSNSCAKRKCSCTTWTETQKNSAHLRDTFQNVFSNNSFVLNVSTQFRILR